VLLLDNSAWARMLAGALPSGHAERLAARMRAGELAACLPFLLEAGYSAHSAADRKALMASLAELPRIAIDEEIERLALHAQRELAEVGHHRLAPMDVMIAACAHSSEGGVLHYDSDYDLILEHTSLVFQSEWLALRGTL
jgi:predicted nucleic acid-binding protein